MGANESFTSAAELGTRVWARAWLPPGATAATKSVAQRTDHRTGRAIREMGKKTVIRLYRW